MFANTDEALSLYQTPHFPEAIDALRGEGVLAVVTRSEKGSIVIEGDEAHEAPAFPVGRVVDTTGAGDMFSAGFLAGLAQRRRSRRLALGSARSPPPRSSSISARDRSSRSPPWRAKTI